MELNLCIYNVKIISIDHNEIVKLFKTYSTTIFDRPAFLGNMLNFIDKAKF